MKTMVVLFVALLIGSNGYLLFALLDTGVSLTYRDQQIHDLEETNAELMRAIPQLAKSISKPAILEILGKLSSEEPYEKNGCVWIGRIGLKFSNTGELLSVSKTWNMGEVDPCYPVF